MTNRECRTVNCKLGLCLLCACMWMTASLQAEPLNTLSLLPAGPSKMLLEGKTPICAEARGEVPVDFSLAFKVLLQPDLMTRVQATYASLLAENEAPEFTIQQVSSNTYFYVNRKDERTDITEIMRGKTAEDCFDIILYSTGERSFGSFEALTHVQVKADGKGRCRYTASVYAYPENAFSRFFARHLGLVERYFKKKTALLTSMITTIACDLCKKEEEQQRAEAERMAAAEVTSPSA